MDSLTWAGGHQSRITFTEGNYYSAEYIATYFESLPSITNVVRDTFQLASATPPYNTYPLINVSAYLEGSSEDPELIIVGGHYDASASNDSDYDLYWETRKAQGADDNASGVAAVMEIARVLSDPESGYSNKNTIKFIAFCAEEYHPMHAGQHHLGSLYDAGEAYKQGLNISAVIVLDMICFNTITDYIEVISNTSSLWLADTVLSSADHYVPDLTTNDYPLPDVSYSDHESYQHYNYPAILLMENDRPWNDNPPYYTHNPYYHKEVDTIETIRISQLEKVTKLGLASVAVLGKREIITAIHQDISTHFEENETKVSISPNPFNSETKINFHLRQASTLSINIYNLLGQQIAKLINDQYYAEGTHNIMFDGIDLPSGTYFCQIVGDSFNEIHKMILMK
jgi:Zn-dependent M28 family amino/carboxypeptidase